MMGSQVPRPVCRHIVWKTNRTNIGQTVRRQIKRTDSEWTNPLPSEPGNLTFKSQPAKVVVTGLCGFHCAGVINLLPGSSAHLQGNIWQNLLRWDSGANLTHPSNILTLHYWCSMGSHPSNHGAVAGAGSVGCLHVCYKHLPELETAW